MRHLSLDDLIASMVILLTLALIEQDHAKLLHQLKQKNRIMEVDNNSS
jgi:hypothetical protein